MSRTKYARIGEQVRIVTPLVFMRCGYPMTSADIPFDEIDELSRTIIRSIGYDYVTKFPKPYMNNLSVKLATAELLKRRGWGGNERKIYEVGFEDEFIFVSKKQLKSLWTVTAKKFVKTGIRRSGGRSQDTPDGPGEYYPPELENEETHCIYYLKQPELTYPLCVLARNCERE